MSNRSVVSLAVVGAALFAPIASAGQPASWPPAAGDRVRVAAEPLSGGPVVAEVLAAEGSTLTLRVPPLKSAVTIPVDSITRFEISRGRRSQAGKGALLGAAGVAVFITAVVALFCEGDCWDSDTMEVLGKTTLAGGLAGGVVGAAITREEWTPVVPRSRPLVSLRFRF